MARPKLNEIRALTDFQTVFRWSLSMTGPSAIPNLGGNFLNVLCESTTLPKVSIPHFDTMIRGHKVRSPGIAQYNNEITFSFVETIDSEIRNFIAAWREALWATNTGVSSALKSALQAEIRIAQLDNQDNEVWIYRLIGCTISDYDLPQIDGTTSDAWRPSVTISYDYFEDGAP